MAKYQYYFFDLDGTLVDIERGITNSVKYVLDSVGVLFGFGSRAELEAAGADYIVNTPEEIMNI